MKVLVEFTEKGTGKRWKVGEIYTGTRGKELVAKGLLVGAGGFPGGEELVKEKKEVEPVKEKIELPTLSTEKVKKKNAK